MDKLKSALTRKFGPLPAWAWAAIAGGALYFYRKHQGAAVSTADQQTAAASQGNYGPYGQDAYPIQGGAGTGGGAADAGAAGAQPTALASPGSGAPTIFVNAPPSDGPSQTAGMPRTQKPKAAHTQKKTKPKSHPKVKRSHAHTHPGSHARPRTPAKPAPSTRPHAPSKPPAKAKPKSSPGPAGHPRPVAHKPTGGRGHR